MSERLYKIQRSKIARLPRDLRVEINRRLHGGEKQASVAAWINVHPVALVILEREFRGAPVSPSNLSEWKKKDEYQKSARKADAIQERVQSAKLAVEKFQNFGANVVPDPPLHVESAMCEIAEGEQPVLRLVVNGILAEISTFTTKLLGHGMVPMLGGPPHSSSKLGLGNKTPQALKDITDDLVIVELCRRLLLDFRQGNLVAGPREVPTKAEARASRWRINGQNDTIRREGGSAAQ